VIDAGVRVLRCSWKGSAVGSASASLTSYSLTWFLSDTTWLSSSSVLFSISTSSSPFLQ